MQILRPSKIIGLSLIIFLLLGQVPPANAIYSPNLNTAIASIKNHLREARKQNGTGSLLNAWNKVNQENKEAKARGEAHGTPGLYSSHLQDIKNSINEKANNEEKGISFIDSFKLYFITIMPPFISHTTCWRDDVWETKAIQEEVTNERLKAALLSDSINASLLRDDYEIINRLIDELVEDFDNTAKWFGVGQKNYYTDCPYGEFDQAFENLGKSWDHLSTVFSGGTSSDWGSLREMAKKNAKRKAANWIKANKIGLTLGGTAGSNPKSLLSGPGLKGLQAELEVGAKYLEEYGQMIYNNIYWNIAGRDSASFETIITAYDSATEGRELAETQMRNEIQFNLQLNNVAEQGLIEVETTLYLINQTILQAAEDGVMETCERLNTLLKRSNKGKNNDTVKCNE